MNLAGDARPAGRDRPNAAAIIDTDPPIGRGPPRSPSSTGRPRRARAGWRVSASGPAMPVLVFHPMSARAVRRPAGDLPAAGSSRCSSIPRRDASTSNAAAPCTPPRALIAGTEGAPAAARVAGPALDSDVKFVDRRIRAVLGASLASGERLRADDIRADDRCRRPRPPDVHQRQHRPAEGRGPQSRLPPRPARALARRSRSTMSPAKSISRRCRSFVLANLGSGVTSVIPDADLRLARRDRSGPGSRPDSAAQGRADRRRRPRSSSGWRDTVRPRGRRLPTLRKLFTGGAPVFPRLLDQIHRMAPAARSRRRSTARPRRSRSPICLATKCRPTTFRRCSCGRGLLAGMPVDKLELRIVRDEWVAPAGPYALREFEALCQAPMQAGEIVVSGDHVLQGYLHGRGDEETKFRVDERTSGTARATPATSTTAAGFGCWGDAAPRSRIRKA